MDRRVVEDVDDIWGHLCDALSEAIEVLPKMPRIKRPPSDNDRDATGLKTASERPVPGQSQDPDGEVRRIQTRRNLDDVPFTPTQVE